jgi:dihydroxyacetone kinase phosphoprotein-dependent L subunit
LRLVAGLEQADRGSVHIGGRDVTHAAPALRDVAFVFQQYSLYPHLSVFDNLAFPLRSPLRPARAADVRRKVEEVARLLRIEDKLQSPATRLSGGQMQRVAIGRALVREPALYLMDEPLSSLDAKLRNDLRLELKRIQQDLGATMLYVTHDQMEALTMATRIGVLEQGRLVQVGTPQDVYEDPASTYVAARLGSPRINLIARALVPGVRRSRADRDDRRARRAPAPVWRAGRERASRSAGAAHRTPRRPPIDPRTAGRSRAGARGGSERRQRLRARHRGTARAAAPALVRRRRTANRRLNVTAGAPMTNAHLIRRVTQTLIDHVEELTALDQAIGDGDHGLNMRRGALAIQARLDDLAGQPLNEALRTMGMTCMATIGGSSGPVFGTLLLTLARELPDPPTASGLARAIDVGIEALTRLGKAEVGQKTLLDVLRPVQETLASGGPDLVERVRQCALDSAAATAQMDAARGRASFLGERALGHVDPGSRSMALIVGAICSSLPATAEAAASSA